MHRYRMHIARKWVVLVAALLSVVAGSLAQNPGGAKEPIAPTPPMGWNSWDVYGTAVTESQVKATADAMAKNLLPYGWQYVVVDIQWYAAEANGHAYKPGTELTMDEFGRLLPAVNRFPSAAGGNGFKALADYVHAKGLKFGIHIMRGIPRQAVQRNCPVRGTTLHASDIADPENICRWNPDMVGVDMTKPGAQAYYNSLAELYASWGVDFVKADDMGSHLYQPAEIKALSTAMRATGRPMVLSISPGPAPVSEAEFFEKYAQMWRISDDFWDDWKLLKKQFEYAREWVPFIGVRGTWPDADMLPFGRLRVTDAAGIGTSSAFTPAEQQTVMTLWSIFRSPLIFGGELVGIDSTTLALLTNPEVLAVNQHSRNNHEVLFRANVSFWSADAPDSLFRYIAACNTSDANQTVAVTWTDLGVPAGKHAVRDLWKRKDCGVWGQMIAELPPHASMLLRVDLH